MDQPLTVDLTELANILHLSQNTVRQLAHKNPERLPPRLDHGGRRVLFLRKDVYKWLEERSAA